MLNDDPRVFRKLHNVFGNVLKIPNDALGSWDVIRCPWLSSWDIIRCLADFLGRYKMSLVEFLGHHKMSLADRQTDRDGDRDRETDRDRESQRQRQRQTDRHRQREIDRDRHTEINEQIQTDRPNTKTGRYLGMEHANHTELCKQERITKIMPTLCILHTLSSSLLFRKLFPPSCPTEC